MSLRAIEGVLTQLSLDALIKNRVNYPSFNLVMGSFSKLCSKRGSHPQGMQGTARCPAPSPTYYEPEIDAQAPFLSHVNAPVFQRYLVNNILDVRIINSVTCFFEHSTSFSLVSVEQTYVSLHDAKKQQEKN